MVEFTHSNGCNIICMDVPGRIECRGLILRTVTDACKLVISDIRARGSLNFDFIDHFVSAVSEAFNNIVLHGYVGREPDTIYLQIENCPEWMRVILKDTGTSYDVSQAPTPELDTLPESGLGIFIMRSCVDEVTYVAGSPNTLTLFKRLDGKGGSGLNDALALNCASEIVPTVGENSCGRPVVKT